MSTASSTDKPLLRTSGAPLHRKPGTTRAEFTARWRLHGALVASWFARYGVENYVQLHLPDTPAPSLSDEDRRLFELVDGVAVVQRRGPSPAAAGESPYFAVILEDERGFLHEESGAGAVKKDKPALELPGWSVEEWREWALRMGAAEERVVHEGRVVIEISREVMDVWERLDK